MFHEELTGGIIGAAIEVHRFLGPGLLESAYEQCLSYELGRNAIAFKRQVDLPLVYKGLPLDCGYRMDFLVDDSVVVELKSVERILPIHEAQLMTYLRISEKRVGLHPSEDVPSRESLGTTSTPPCLRGEPAVPPALEDRTLRPRRWRMSAKSTDAAAADLARDLDLQVATARILANRGYSDPDRARTFLAPSFSQLPDPALMKGMDAAVGVIMRALRENRRIVCHGDYDVDGVSGATILVEFLRGVGADVVPFIPDRSRHGYGFSRASLADCAALGAKVVITCDCGTASVAEVDEAAALGIEVVITDHHEPGPVLPRAAALLNPKQPGETFPDTDLCGTGVAFFLLIALRRALRESGHFASRPQPNLRAMLDIVTMAIIGDVVPLRGVNRVLACEGMGILAAGTRIGIAALKEVAGSRDRFNEVSVAFALAPRINAAGRLGSAAAALDLLLCRDPMEAKRLAGLLDGENTKRREIEARMLDEALAQVASDPAVSSAPAIVLASDRWHMGVVGIIAARMVDRFHRPSMVLAIGDAGADGRRLARGSARSIRGFDLYKGLTRCADHMVGYGGHPMAAGMTVAESEIPALRAAFIREAAAVLGADDFMPELTIDCAVETADLHERLVDELVGLGPHGASNPEPVLLLRNARVAQSRIVGKNHLRMDLATARGRLEAIAFGFGACQPALPEHLDVAFVPQRRAYNGRTFTELRVRDLSLGAVSFR